MFTGGPKMCSMQKLIDPTPFKINVWEKKKNGEKAFLVAVWPSDGDQVLMLR